MHIKRTIYYSPISHRRLLLLFLLIVIPSAVFPQLIFNDGFEPPPTWKSLGGPEGGKTYVLAISPKDTSVVYAAAVGGSIYRSSDGGQSWSFSSKGLEQYLGWNNSYAMAVSHLDTETVYTAIFGGGVFKTTDGGGTWISANDGLDNSSIFDLRIDPQSHDVLYAATHYGGIYKTVNGGLLWEHVNLPSESMLQAFATEPNNFSALYAAFRSGLYRSIDGGKSWLTIGEGIPGDAEITSITVDPRSTQIVYFGTDVGVYKSLDSGETSNLLIGSPIWSRHIYFASDSTELMYAQTAEIGEGSWKSINSGQDWELVFSWSSSFAIDPNQNHVLLAGTSDKGIYKSTDEGSSWILSNSGIHSTVVSALAIHPVSDELYAGTSSHGIHKYRKSSWTQIYDWSIPGHSASSAKSIVIETNPPNAVYVGATSGGSVFRTIDEGQSWSVVDDGLVDWALLDMFREKNSDAIYASFNNTRMYRLVDGPSWELLSDNIGTDPNGLWSIAADPTNTQTIYTGSSQGVFKSTDSGSTWSAASNGLPSSNVYALAHDPVNAHILYAGIEGGEIYKTVDSGDSWTIVFSPEVVVGSWPAVYKIVLDPTDPNTIFSAIRSVGVIMSEDGGISWNDISTGLPTRQIFEIELDSRTNTLYIGTQHLGAFYYRLP